MFGLNRELDERKRLYRKTLESLLRFDSATIREMYSTYPNVRDGHKHPNIEKFGAERVAVGYAQQLLCIWIDGLSAELRDQLSAEFQRTPWGIIESMYGIEKGLGVAAVTPPGMSDGSFFLAMSVEAANDLAGNGKIKKEEVKAFMEEIMLALLGHDAKARMEFHARELLEKHYPGINDPDPEDDDTPP